MTRQDIAAQLLKSFTEAGMSQSELARRMTKAGHANYRNQMTVSRTLSGQRAVPAHEYAALVEILPTLPPIGVSTDETLRAHIAELQEFKRRVLAAVAEEQG